MKGRSLSHYEILELAGRGSMGEVYVARDRRLGRKVALKVISNGPISEERRRRFLREARTAALASHPGIVGIFDVGREDGIDFIVMEWVEGATLASEIERGPLPVDNALDLAGQVADAMAAAHATGVVHRDLKPANVMIDARGAVRVLDFGVARFDPLVECVETRTSEDLTATGASPGTIAYMSPEQILGEPVDARSDVFSLGVVLYEMLTGQRPFRQKGLVGMTRAVAFAEPEPLQRSSPPIPFEVEGLVFRALAKSPDVRHQDMDSLAADVRRCRETLAETHPETLSVRPPDAATVEHRREKPARHRALVVAAALVSMVSLLAAGTWLVLPETSSYQLGTTQGTNNPGSEPTDGAPSESWPESPFELSRQGLRFLDRYDREGYLDHARERFEEALARDEDYALAHSGLARVDWRQYRLRGDRVWLDRARASVERALELAPQLTHARVGRSLIEIASGRSEAARRDLATLRRLDPAEADVPAAQAELAVSEGRYGDAASLYREALELRPDDWAFWIDLGIAEARDGDLAAAEAALLESLARVSDNAFAHRNLAGIYHYLGRYEEAAQELQASISIRPSSAAYSNLGTIYFFQGQYREAARAFESARALGANNYLLWANLGDAYRQIAGRRDEARDCFRRAVQLLRDELESGEDDAQRRTRLALYLAKLGDAEGALRELDALGDPGQRDAAESFRAALTYEIAGRRAEALEALRLALEARHPLAEILREPELARLREDVRFHELVLPYDSGESSSSPG